MPPWVDCQLTQRFTQNGASGVGARRIQRHLAVGLGGQLLLHCRGVGALVYAIYHTILVLIAGTSGLDGLAKRVDVGGVLYVGSEGRGAIGPGRGVGEAPVPLNVAARGVEGGTLRIKVTSRQGVMKVADAVGDSVGQPL